MPGSLGEKTGGESLNIKGSTISHMAAVHPGISYREPYRNNKKKKAGPSAKN